MVIAKLIGNVWATRKYDSLNGLKFMLVEILDGSEKNKKIVAVDTIGAGRGDR
ncbi:MAG: EutN/CcmL family microcompartment protein, partial [Anaerococcus obesiensis]